MSKNNAILEMTVQHDGKNIRIAVADSDLHGGLKTMLAYIDLLLQNDPAMLVQFDEQIIQSLQTQNATARLNEPLHPEQIWFDYQMDCFKRGTERLPDMTPTEHHLLRYFVENPYKQHTHSTLCVVGWPETHIDGVTPECMYQMIRGLRGKIEQDPKQPQYIVNWRGYPEGGYRFYPAGNMHVN